MGLSPAAASQWLPHIQEAARIASLNTRERLAAFLAQVGHESGSFRYTREIWGPTPTQLRYEGRKDLGNTQPGDGFRFRGRGLIQTTGRANYRATGVHLGVDLEANPELLEQPRFAARSAAYYWAANNLNHVLETLGHTAVGRAVNRGNARATKPANGEADRLVRYSRALKELA